MLDDAIYYSRREAEELLAAKQAKNLRATQIHAMLADRYGQLARRALADLPESRFNGAASHPTASPSAFTATPRRFR